MYRLLRRLECLGLLKPLIDKGVVSCKLPKHREIYEGFLAYKSKGVKTTQAVTNVSIDFGVGETTVYDIMASMRC